MDWSSSPTVQRVLCTPLWGELHQIALQYKPLILRVGRLLTHHDLSISSIMPITPGLSTPDAANNAVADQLVATGNRTGSSSVKLVLLLSAHLPDVLVLTVDRRIFASARTHQPPSIP